MENRLYNSNNRAVINEFGVVRQVTNYYPFGGVFSTTVYNSGDDLQPYKYNGKELDRTHGLDWYDYGARNYDAFLPIFTSLDPHCEGYYNISPYAYCANNPINAIDPTGRDTLNISYTNDKWIFDNPIIAKGNDVFNVTIDGQTSTYTFSEGEWGERVDALNLESNSEYTLGVYHVSGTDAKGTGYYVTPGGMPSCEEGSGARIPEGQYPIFAANGRKWKKPGVGGRVFYRYIRFHHEVSKNHNPRISTQGCFVLAYDYKKTKSGHIIYDREDSKAASRNFDELLGSERHFQNGIYEGSEFKKPITHKLLLKSRKQWKY